MNFNRCEQNPIITAKDLQPSADNMEIIGVFNCGVTEYNGKILLLLRVAERIKSNNNYVKVPVFDEELNKLTVKEFDKSNREINFSDVRFVKTKQQLYLTSISHIRIATSLDGVNFDIESLPFIKSDNKYEEFGVEDPRITLIDGCFFINYSAISKMGVFTCLAKTIDFKTVEKLGIIFLQDNKDVAIFPQKIGGEYYALHRPVSAYFNRPEIWISKSKDLLAYYNHKVLCHLTQEGFDSSRIGASCVPFLTDYGWIEIYHGCNNQNYYYLGALLLDKDNPEKVLARSDKPLFTAETEYELNGFMPKVIFSCGALVKGDIIHLYYGNCDESVCYGTLTVSGILQELGQI